MKKILFLLVVVFLPCLGAYAQAIIGDAVVASILQETKTEYLIQYGYMLNEAIKQVDHFKTMIEQTGQQINMSMQNLKSIKDIHSWDDFMDFYNRQLYFEKMAVESVKGMNVTIGKKNYSLYDLEGIADGLTDTYIEYWNNEFNEEQRKEMWLNLGLSPANYAYVLPYREKGREVTRQLLAMSDIQNRKNIKTSEANKKDDDDLVKDAALPLNEQMGEKEVLQRLLRATIRTSEGIGDMSAILAKQAEMQAIDKYLNRPLKQTPEISSWSANGFAPK